MNQKLIEIWRHICAMFYYWDTQTDDTDTLPEALTRLPSIYNKNQAQRMEASRRLLRARRKYWYEQKDISWVPTTAERTDVTATINEYLRAQGKYTLQEQVTIKRAADRKRYSWFVRWEEFAQIKSDTPLYLQRVRIAK